MARIVAESNAVITTTAVPGKPAPKLITAEMVAGAAFIAAETTTTQMTVATAASGLIGAVTFWGSLIAFFKLQNVKWIPDG